MSCKEAMCRMTRSAYSMQLSRRPIIANSGQLLDNFWTTSWHTCTGRGVAMRGHGQHGLADPGRPWLVMANLCLATLVDDGYFHLCDTISSGLGRPWSSQPWPSMASGRGHDFRFRFPVRFPVRFHFCFRFVCVYNILQLWCVSLKLVLS